MVAPPSAISITLHDGAGALLLDCNVISLAPATTATDDQVDGTAPLGGTDANPANMRGGICSAGVRMATARGSHARGRTGLAPAFGCATVFLCIGRHSYALASIRALRSAQGPLCGWRRAVATAVGWTPINRQLLVSATTATEEQARAAVQRLFACRMRWTS